MRARPAYIDWRTYLDASLFPFKVYTVLAVVCILGCRAFFSKDNPLMADLDTFGFFAAYGYVYSAMVLMVGGLIQAAVNARRAAIWNLLFAVGALVIGICMLHYFTGPRFYNPFGDLKA